MVKKVKIADILKKLEIKKLKPKQKEIINLFLKKDKPDTIGILPTGYGKSLCYIIPHLLKNKNVIVISPLISLMEDQAIKLREKNINTLIFNSNYKPFSKTEGQTSYSKVLKGEESYIMYFSPESFQSNGFYIRQLIEYNRVSMIAIDECHCVSSWSEFRNDYNKLFTIKEWINKYQRKIYVLALTATATTSMIEDISHKLQLKNPVIIKESLYKDNLKIKIYTKSSLNNDTCMMNGFLKNLSEDSKAIVYCKTRNDTEKISNQLKSKYGIKCTHYHAGLTPTERTKAQEDYRDSKLKVIAATIAFGMGIDDKHIHMIIHYGISKNIESYYQEIGRGGRNGGMVDCYVFWSGRDFSTNRYFIKQVENKNTRDIERKKLDELEKFIKSDACRMQFICDYFDDTVNVCSKCDNCQRSMVYSLKNQIKENRNTIICNFMIIDTMINLNQGIGMTNLSLLLRGSKSKKITNRMRELCTYGKMSHCKETTVRKKVEKLHQKGFISQIDIESGWGSYYKVNSKGNDWYQKNKYTVKKSISILQKFVNVIRNKIKNIPTKKKEISTTSINKKMKLIEWRNKKAKETNLPQYCILKNSVIDNIIIAFPKNKTQLINVKGVGKKIIEKYGDDILSLLS